MALTLFRHKGHKFVPRKTVVWECPCGVMLADTSVSRLRAGDAFVRKYAAPRCEGPVLQGVPRGPRRP